MFSRFTFTEVRCWGGEAGIAKGYGQSIYGVMADYINWGIRRPGIDYKEVSMAVLLHIWRGEKRVRAPNRKSSPKTYRSAFL